MGAISSKGTPHVMQHERKPLGGSQPFEYHKQRKAARVGE
jgi:hypothetical protein